MTDRIWRIVLSLGIVTGSIAILLSLLGGSHLHWTTGGGDNHIDLRIGAGGGVPSDVLGTVSIICLLMGAAFLALSKKPSDGKGPPAADNVATFLEFLKALRRSARDRWLGGVCGGLGAYSPVPSWVWRAIFIMLIFCGGTGVMAYIILWICIPGETANPPGGRTP
jgi:phage shock protein PspC (stress-responsive transcriptional regulator)